MKYFFLSFVVAFVLIIILDLIWFSYSVEKFYKIYLTNIISFDVNKKAALVFYFIYSFAIIYLCKDFVSGFVLGIAAYSAYNFTNLATIPNWPLIVVVIDTLWGGIVTAITAYCVSYIKN